MNVNYFLFGIVTYYTLEFHLDMPCIVYHMKCTVGNVFFQCHAPMLVYCSTCKNSLGSQSLEVTYTWRGAHVIVVHMYTVYGI